MSSPLLSVCCLSRGGVVFVKATRTIIYAEWFKKTHNYKHFLQSTLGLQVHKCFLDSIFNHSSWKSLGEKNQKTQQKTKPNKNTYPRSGEKYFFLNGRDNFVTLHFSEPLSVLVHWCWSWAWPQEREPRWTDASGGLWGQTLSWWEQWPDTDCTWHDKSCSHQLWASSYCFVNFSCSQGAVYRTTVDWSLISQTLRKQKERGRKPTSNCPKQPEQKQSSPSLQHLEELIVTADPNYYDNNAATLIAL